MHLNGIFMEVDMVTLSFGNGRSGSQAIAQAASERLTSNSNLSTQRISCDYMHGVLRLHGRLPTYYQKQVAQEVVKGLDGVDQVVNNIEVVG